MTDDHDTQTENEQPGAFERYRDAALEFGGIVVDGFLDLF